MSRYVVHGHRLEVVCENMREAHVVRNQVIRQARTHPYDRELWRTSRTIEITREPIYLLARSWPLLALAFVLGALLAA